MEYEEEQSTKFIEEEALIKFIYASEVDKSPHLQI